MGKAKKATRKFNQKHLKGELERRKEHKKVQKGIQKRDAKKKQQRKKSAAGDGSEEGSFTGIGEIDELTDFTQSVPKGIKGDEVDMDQLMMDEGDDGSDISDEENLAQLLDAGSDSDSEMEDDDDGDDEDLENEDLGENEEEDEEEVFKKELEAMSTKDPSFFEYMKKNDPNSLTVLDEASEEGQEEDDDDEASDEEMGDSEPKSKKTAVTTAMLDNWEQEINKKHSIKAFKKLLLAFYSASHMESENDNSVETPFLIEGMNIFNRTITVTIRTAAKTLGYYAPVVDDKVNKNSGKAPWKVVQALLKSYLSSLLELLKQMGDASMVQFLIKETEKVVPYFACFAKYSQGYVKELLRQFGAVSADDGVRVQALLSLRRIVGLPKSGVADIALKGIYLTYVRNSNVKTVSNLTTIHLMRNCGVELYGYDANASYQHAFVYIRQLAIHLRNSMQLRNKESFRAVYNWQFINSLSFWTEVLATYCGDRAEDQPKLCATLESLVYPLTQIIIGVARLVPTAKYFPLRIHCIEQLLRLSSATGIFIPVLPFIIEMLESPDFLNRRPINSTLKPLNMDAELKAPKEYEHTRVYLDTVLESVFGLLADAIASQSVRIAFPELVVPTVIQIRRWRKRVGKSWIKFSKQLQGLLEKIDQTSKLVLQQRGKIDFAPSNMTSANQFMSDVSCDSTPIGKYAQSLRKVKEQQRAALVSSDK